MAEAGYRLDFLSGGSGGAQRDVAPSLLPSSLFFVLSGKAETPEATDGTSRHSRRINVAESKNAWAYTTKISNVKISIRPTSFIHMTCYVVHCMYLVGLLVVRSLHACAAH